MDPNATKPCQYQYSPLPSAASIRLIELHASTASEISFTIYATEVDNAPPFDALSYTWGNPGSPCIEPRSADQPALNTARFPVTCNGLTLMIRPNLRDALRMLQTACFASLGRRKQRYIWIDAVCIDQTNNAERALQVMLMTSLYRKAESVIVWLGPEDETTADAFTVIDQLSSISAIPESISEILAVREPYSLVTAEDISNPQSYRSKLGIEPLTHQHWLAWLALLHRPYFKRAWVVQEVTLAKSITAVCGTRFFDWQKLSGIIWFLVHTKWFLKIHTEYFRHRVAREVPVIYSKMLSLNLDPGFGAMYLNQTRTGTELAGKFYTLEVLLKNHRHCEASDPRDMIYALQGIARKDSKPFTSHGHLLVPDYSIPVKRLYTRTARIMLQSNGDLRFLSHREGKRWRSIETLPSWVPDYSVGLLPDPMVMRGPNCNWCAAGNLQWKVDSRHHDDPSLDVQGIFIGDVGAKSENPSGSEDDDRVWASVCEVAQGLLSYYSLDPEPDLTDLDYIQTLQTRVEVLWRTLVADTFQGQHPAPPECGEQFLAHASAIVGRIMKKYKTNKDSFHTRVTGRMHSFLYRTLGRSINENKIGPWIKLFGSEPNTSHYKSEVFVQKLEEIIARSTDQSIRTEEEWSRPFADFRREVDVTLGPRRLFRTTRGLLGMGPLEIEMGDEVWILAGANTPVVLRNGSTGKKKLLGEAYVHGLMHGEVLNFGLDLDDITLE